MTNSLTKGGVAGVSIAESPDIKDVAMQTDSGGAYAATLPIGAYTLTFKKDNYAVATETVSVVAGQKSTKEVALKPNSPVVVSAGAAQTGAPGASVSLKGAVDVLDGSANVTYAWSQTAGAKATISGGATANAAVTLASAAAYKEALVSGMKEVLDRAAVVGIDPHMLGAAETTTFKLEVTTTSGTYSSTVKVTTDLPYAVSTSLATAPVGVPVLVQGKKLDTYAWTLAGPTGTKAALDSTTSRFPSFTPDVAGKYTLTEAKGAKVEVYAGAWAGAISGVDGKGLPLSATCTVCHNGKIAPDTFTAWKASGHAEIFTQNIENPAGHWSTSCASCHTVGYDPGANNGGFDEAMKAEGWQVPAHGDKGLWATIVAKYPKTAKLANIQCENCHGPNDASGTHMAKPATGVNTARVSLSSAVCGSCHGEPPSHGRYQQWEESGHASFELAVSRAGSSSCVRCHNAQGFLAWIKQADMTKPLQGKAGNATAAELVAMGITAETAQPVTCAVCHDPHDVGVSSGDPNTARVRISGDTSMLPSGYKALGVGRGALCITCHNTRNGAHNDSTGLVATALDSAPHTAAQGDVLMGQNAYFVTVGARAAHSYLADTCATCHMERTPPPEALSRAGRGTNHSFKASTKICSDCHGAYDGGTLEKATQARLVELEKAIASAIIKEIGAQIKAGNKVVLVKMGAGGVDVVITDASKVTAVELIESHGRQAMDITVAGTKYEHVRLASDTAVKNASDITVGTLLTSAAGQSIAKAGWNYWLLHSDGSEGIHNPGFTNDVINATLNALK